MFNNQKIFRVIDRFLSAYIFFIFFVYSMDYFMILYR